MRNNSYIDAIRQLEDLLNQLNNQQYAQPWRC
jgi:hypothetical protein